MDAPIGLRPIFELLIGYGELGFLQSRARTELELLLKNMCRTPGLLVRQEPEGHLGGQWRVRNLAGAIIFEDDQQPVAVDENGKIIIADLREFETTFPAVPDDAVWRTLVVRASTTSYARGTIDFTAASTLLTGTDTEFTTMAGFTTDGFDQGTIIRIEAADSAGGNDGDYEIDTITSDVVADARTNANGANETGVPFKVIGRFYSGTPPATPGYQERPIAEFELVAQTRVPAAGDLVLADVMLDTGSSPDVQFIDRRHQNLFRLLTSPESWSGLSLQPRLTVSTAMAVMAVSATFETAPATAVLDTSICMRHNQEGGLVAYTDGTLLKVRSFGTGGLFGAANTVDPTASKPCIRRSPVFDQIWLLYIDANQLWARLSSDDGSTWSGATLIWDPTAVDPADTLDNPDMVVLPNGRFVVCCDYYDDSAGTTTIRTIFSDDYGTAWDTAANVGYACRSADGSIKGSLWASPSSDLLAVAHDAPGGVGIMLAAEAGGDGDAVVNDSAYTFASILTGLSTTSHGRPRIAGDEIGNMAILTSGISAGGASYLTLFPGSAAVIDRTAIPPVRTMGAGKPIDLFQTSADASSTATGHDIALVGDGTAWISTVFRSGGASHGRVYSVSLLATRAGPRWPPREWT